MPAPINEPKNLLINALSKETQRRLLPHLELVKLKQGSIISESVGILKNVYFPIDSLVSLIYMTSDGASSEVSQVGNEGFVGLALYMEGESPKSSAVVQKSGYAYRLSSKKFKEELNRQGDLQELMLRYVRSLFKPQAQAASLARAEREAISNTCYTMIAKDTGRVLQQTHLPQDDAYRVSA